MPFYAYKARDNTGKLTEGLMEAEAQHQAVVKLQQSGLFVLELRETKEKKAINKEIALFTNNRIKLKDLSVFCRQLSFMLEAGISLLAGLQIILESQSPLGIKRLAEGLSKELKTGHSFGEACANFQKDLPSLMIDMVSAGEVGGFLDSALERLANYFDKEVQTREKVKTAMIYPMVILGIAVIAISVIFTLVVPVFAGILTDMDITLPLGTRIILTISLFYKNYWYLIFLGTILLILGFLYYRKTPKGKKQFDELSFKIPILKDLSQKIIVARFCRTLANLLKSGVPILQALEVVSRTIGNERLRAEIETAQKNVKDGLNLTDSFSKSRVFPPMVVQMIAVGERSGDLDSLLVKVGDYYDNEVEEATDRLPKLIEPIMLMFLGVVVGTIVMGVLLPMFSVMNNIGG